MIQLFLSPGWEFRISGGQEILIYGVLTHTRLQYLTRLMQQKFS